MTAQLSDGLNRFAPRPIKGAGALLMLCALLLAPGAQGDATDGQFVVRSAITELDDSDVYTLTADIAYSLTQPAIQALTSNIPLTFELQIDVSRERRWLPDDKIATLLQRYELSYHALTERYVVRNLNSGEQENYGTLAAALHALGQIESLPVIDKTLVKENRRYRIAMRSTLDLKSFPGPLRLLASLFRFNDWRLASKWHSWALNP